MIEDADPASELTLTYREADGGLVVEGTCDDAAASARPSSTRVAQELLDHARRRVRRRQRSTAVAPSGSSSAQSARVDEHRRRRPVADRSRCSPSTARTGDRRIRNELVELHLDVAEYYVKRYSRRGVPADDLRQVALLTILRAVDRFDPEHGRRVLDLRQPHHRRRAQALLPRPHLDGAPAPAGPGAAPRAAQGRRGADPAPRPVADGRRAGDASSTTRSTTCSRRSRPASPTRPPASTSRRSATSRRRTRRAERMLGQQRGRLRPRRPAA